MAWSGTLRHGHNLEQEMIMIVDRLLIHRAVATGGGLISLWSQIDQAIRSRPHRSS
jgi:hypothetical protein